MRLTLRGWTCLMGGLVWVVGGYVVGVPGLFAPGLFLVALPLTALVALIPARLGARARRRVPDTPVMAGRPFIWHIDLRLGGANPGGEGELTETVGPALGDSFTVQFRMGAKARDVSFAMRAVPAWRGRHPIGPSLILVQHPLRLAAAKLRVSGGDSVLATPPVYPLGSARGLPAADGGAQSSLQRAGVTGVDDAMIREYRAGDDIRRIHWRSTARLGDLMVRGEEDTWDPRACLILDTRAEAFSTDRPDTRFEAAVELIASLAVHLLRNGYRLVLADTSGHVHRLDADPVVAEQEALVTLAEVQPDGGPWLLHDDLNEMGGYLVATVLGDADEASVLRLTGQVPRGNGHWALVLGRGEPAALRVVDLFREAGWSCTTVSPLTPPYRAWQPCLSGVSR